MSERLRFAFGVRLAVKHLVAWAIVAAFIIAWGRFNRHTPIRVNAKGEPIAPLLKKRGAR